MGVMVAAVVDKQRAKVRILDYLSTAQVGTTRGVCVYLDIHERSAQRYMRELLGDGLVEVVRRGYHGEPQWRLTTEGTQAVDR